MIADLFQWLLKHLKIVGVLVEYTGDFFDLILWRDANLVLLQRILCIQMPPYSLDVI